MNETRETLLADTCEILERNKDFLEEHAECWDTSGKFIVILPSGVPIRRQTPRKTFNQVIRMLGVEDVFNLEIRTPKRLLISNEPGRNQELEIAPGRYIQTAFSNRQKAKILLDIAEGLNIELFIIDTATNNKLISAWRIRDRRRIYLTDENS